MNGPTGKPHAVIARSMASIGAPSDSSRLASFRYGVRMRLTKKPGRSRTTMTVLPILRPNATAVTTVCGAVRSAAITSSSGILCTGEKKCIPTTVSGCADASAMRPIGIVDVFDAKTHSGPVAASTSRSTACFTARSSNTASTTRSARRNPA